MPGRWRRRVLGAMGKPEAYVVATDAGVDVVVPGQSKVHLGVDQALDFGFLVLNAARESIRLSLRSRVLPRLRPVRALYAIGDRLRGLDAVTARRDRITGRAARSGR